MSEQIVTHDWHDGDWITEDHYRLHRQWAKPSTGKIKCAACGHGNQKDAPCVMCKCIADMAQRNRGIQ